MKLEPMHLMPYLPFNLMVWNENYEKCYHKKASPITGISIDKNGKYTSCFVDVNRNGYPLSSNISLIKPVLKPLSDFNDVFTDLFDDDLDVRTFTNEDFLKEHGFGSLQELQEMKIEWYPVGLFNLLIKHHFDIFGLIEKDLAVNMNELSLVAL